MGYWDVSILACCGLSFISDGKYTGGSFSCFSGSQMPLFLYKELQHELLRCLHPGLLWAVPVMVCCSQQNTMMKNNSERKGLAFPESSSIEEHQDKSSNLIRTWRQKLTRRPWKKLVPHCLFSLISYRIEDHQPRDDTIYELVLLTSITYEIKYL